VLKWFLSWFGSLQRKYVLGAVVALVLVTVLFGVMFRSGDSRAIARTLRNPLSIFAGRSPGPRADGVLYQTKPKLAATHRQRPRPLGLVPHERVLSTGRARPLVPFAPAAEAPPLALLGTPTPLAFAPGLGGPEYLPSAFDVPGFGFGDVPGFAGVGGPPESEAPPPGGPGPAVPEPATWLMLIVGFGWIGHSLRRNRAAVPASTHRG
jgi:hypothetical protein